LSGTKKAARIILFWRIEIFWRWVFAALP